MRTLPNSLFLNVVVFRYSIVTSCFRFTHRLTGAGGHNAVKLVVTWEVIHKGQDHVPEKDKPLSGAGIADMRCLLGGDIQPLTEYLPVAAGLVEKVDEITVL